MRRRAWTLPNNYRGAFVRHTDPAAQRVRTVSTRVGPNLKPVDLVLTGDHPRGRVGRMMGLVHIVRSVHINVGGIRIHQDTTARVPFLWNSVHFTQPDTGDEASSDAERGAPQYSTLDAEWPQALSSDPDWQAWNRAIELEARDLASQG
jgi:hypothetical protein